MTIKLDNKYIITTDENNFTLNSIEVYGETAKNVGEEYYKAQGYYGTLQAALKGYLKLSLRKSSEGVDTAESLISRLAEIEQHIMNMKVEK